MVAGCYVLVDHSKRGVPPSSNAQEASAEDPTLDANAIPERKIGTFLDDGDAARNVVETTRY